MDDQLQRHTDLLVRVYGAGTMEGDPDWVRDMLDAMAENPALVAGLEVDAARADAARAARRAVSQQS